jgi:colanic acid/amylovoran biosynthesis glycosyltransferase
MKIAVLTHLFPVASDTPFLNQVVGLVDRGHEVDVYADAPQPGYGSHPDVERLGLAARTRYPERLPDATTARWRAAARLVLGSTGRDRRILLASLNPFTLWRRAWSLDQLRRTRRFLPPQPHDVCYCAFGQDAPHALRLRRLGALTGRLVVAFRGADTTKYVARRGPRVYAGTFRSGDVFLPVCDFLGRRLIDMGAAPERVVVHRTGIDLRQWPCRERRPASDGRLRLVTIARLVEKKGIEYVLQAVKALTDARIPVEYEVLGEGPLREPLARDVERLGLSDRVRFHGWQTQAEVRARLDLAHALVQASVTGRDGDEEGIPNVLKEAMAAGMPVVATRHAGIPELVEDGVSGFLVPERDPGALASALSSLARAPERWVAMGRAGRARIEREYDIEMLNDRLADLFAHVSRMQPGER